MKHILILSLIFFSCNKEVEAPIVEPIVCCDIVKEVTSFNLPDGTKFGTYITINNCSQVQVNGNWSEGQGQVKPIIGECY